MASRNHTIRVPDEVWAEWTEQAKQSGMSITSRIIASMSLVYVSGASIEQSRLRPGEIVLGEAGAKPIVNSPSENRTFRPFTKDQQLKKVKK